MLKSASLPKLSILNSIKKNSFKGFDLENDTENQAKWLHHGKEVKDTFIAFNAKFLGSMDVSQPKGVDMVKDSIKKLKIQRQLKKADAGHKASKLVKVEIIISIDAIKVVEQKNRNMICARPLQRVSYCADDHRDKRLFAFIAKEQDTKCHKCFVFVSEKEASEITLTLGQAFQLAYKRYLEKEKTAKKEAAAANAANMEKENEKLKEENDKLKQVLEKSKGEQPHLVNGEAASDDNTSPVEVPTPSMNSTLPSATFGFLPTSPQQQQPTDIADMNDIFLTGFDQPSDDTFNPRQTNHNPNHNPTSNQNLFASTPTTPPRVEDFIVKQDPFADTPDWIRTASAAEKPRTQSLTEQYANGNNGSVNGTNQVTLENGHCNRNNPFLNGNNNTNSTKSFNDPSSDLFSQYLSNVVAQRDPNNGPANGMCTPTSSVESFLSDCTHSNGSSSRSNNSLDHFNISNICEFSVNNEFDFDKMNIADSCGKTISDFKGTDDGFFTDDNFIPRPKAHTITVLTTEEQKFHDLTPRVSQMNGGGTYSMGGEAINNNNNLSSNTNDFNDDHFNETYERPKAKSVGASYNQAVRPRPTSLAVQSQVLPAPPSKSSIKKPATLLIQTPPQKMTTSTPLKEEPTDDQLQVIEDRPMKPRSQSYILPNVRTTGPILPETRARSRSRHVPLQSQPLKESISRASKSLEDLCCLESPSSNNSISPKSTPGGRVPPPFPNPFTPTATTPQF